MHYLIEIICNSERGRQELHPQKSLPPVCSLARWFWQMSFARRIIVLINLLFPGDWLWSPD